MLLLGSSGYSTIDSMRIYLKNSLKDCMKYDDQLSFSFCNFYQKSYNVLFVRAAFVSNSFCILDLKVFLKSTNEISLKRQ